MKISIIIPTYNEAENIGALLQLIKQADGSKHIETIVVDGGSTDNTIKIASEAGADVVVLAPQRGRANQMNYGASLAKYEVLYFVHADTSIHKDYYADIHLALQEGYAMGCYRYVFDSKSWLLKINAFFTRFKFIWCRGGDQTLFVTQKTFKALGGYKPMKIMEEYDFIQRAWDAGYPFKIIPKNIVVSARKYETNSYLRVQWANFRVMQGWRTGKKTDEELAALYKKLLHYR